MSLYNILNGYNPCCLLVMPMLGRKQDEYPRFRDCFISEDEERIVIFTRVGGGNRNCGYGEEELYNSPYFVKTYDDDYDPTYGYYEFNVPNEWKDDFKKIVDGKLSEVSGDYYRCVSEFYPVLAKGGLIAEIFRPDTKRNSENES